MIAKLCYFYVPTFYQIASLNTSFCVPVLKGIFHRQYSIKPSRYLIDQVLNNGFIQDAPSSKLPEERGALLADHIKIFKTSMKLVSQFCSELEHKLNYLIQGCIKDRAPAEGSHQVIRRCLPMPTGEVFPDGNSVHICLQHAF